MKKVTYICNLLLAAALTVGPLCAVTIDTPYTNNEQMPVQIDYTFRTTGSGSINTGQTRFDPSTGQVIVSDSVTYNYVIPNGATINQALIDFSALFSWNNDLQVQMTSGSGFFIPAFSRSAGAGSVQISSGAITATVNSLSGSYDLLPLFSAQLLANAPITVSYRVVEQFAANNSAYNGATNNQTETFQLTESLQFQTTGANRLFVTYDSTATQHAPEPGSMVLAGIGLACVLAGRLRKR
jgi:hypothetical protein